MFLCDWAAVPAGRMRATPFVDLWPLTASACRRCCDQSAADRPTFDQVAEQLRWGRQARWRELHTQHS